MAGNKQKSLTRLDNNYQINLRYPDINEFLKDTFFSLQDNQTIERTLLANARVVTNSVKSVHTIVVVGYSVQVLLSDLVIYGFSPDQEIIYDFLIEPEILSLSLANFTASRADTYAKLQSVQTYSLSTSETVANFSITLSSKKIAELLSELFTTHAEEVKAILDLTDDFALLDYVLSNLFSLSFTFLCSYRLQSEDEHQIGFRVPMVLSYLVPSLYNQTVLKSTKIEVPNYNSNSAQNAPQLLFKGIYDLTGELQLSQTNGSNKYVDSNKTSVIKSDQQREFRTEFRTADYVWRTLSGVDSTPPTITYNYTFAAQNSTAKYAGTFGDFKSPMTTTGSFVLRASNYAVQLQKYKEAVTNADKYAASISFALSNSNSKQTALSSLFTVIDGTGGSKITTAPNLFMQVDLLDFNDKTRVVSASPTAERSVFLTTLNHRNAFGTNANTQTTLSGCFLFTSANTDANRNQFSKTTQRVLSTYSGVPNFTSARLGIIKPQVSLTAPTTDPKGLLTVTLQWPSLDASELAALHQLTTASGIQVSLLDSFMNVLAVTDKVYSTANKLARAESPLVNPSITYCAEIDYTSTLLASDYKNPISRLLTSPQRAVAPYLRVLKGPTVATSRLLDYTTPEFTLRDNIYCIAQWMEPSQFDKSLQEKWSMILHRPTQSQIDITSTAITVSAAQKVSLAQSLFANTTKRPAVYSIYILLPWVVVRDSNFKKSVVRSELVSGKYTYAYAIRV
jgi:hypothetical protein